MVEGKTNQWIQECLCPFSMKRMKSNEFEGLMGRGILKPWRQRYHINIYSGTNWAHLQKQLQGHFHNLENWATHWTQQYCCTYLTHLRRTRHWSKHLVRSQILACFILVVMIPIQTYVYIFLLPKWLFCLVNGLQ